MGQDDLEKLERKLKETIKENRRSIDDEDISDLLSDLSDFYDF